MPSPASRCSAIRSAIRTAAIRLAALARPVIDLLRDGSLLFVWAEDPAFLAASRLLPAPAVAGGPILTAAR